MSGEKRNIRLSKCSVDQNEKDAVARVLDSHFLGMGVEVQQFEKEIKSFLKTELEVILVNTGTAALHLALEALDLPEGSEVLVPSLTYVASHQAISAAGLKPVSCDVLNSNGFIDLNDAAKRITIKTKVIMPVHYSSNSIDIPAVYEFAKKHNLRVVEDAAHSFGNQRAGKWIGQEGDILCFSFDGIKNITSGEGGCVVTADNKVVARIQDARLLGVENDTKMRFERGRSWVFAVKHQGYRYHMSDIMAAIGREQLKKAPMFFEKRKAIAQMYFKMIAQFPLLKPVTMNHSEIVPHIFVCQTVNEKRDRFVAFMQEEGVAIGLHYYANHLHDFFKTDYSLPVIEDLHERLVTFPFHFGITEEDINYIEMKLKKFFN
jgi:dTDP-4-amino-4,6-dideoxygalactose transaminase